VVASVSSSQVTPCNTSFDGFIAFDQQATPFAWGLGIGLLPELEILTISNEQEPGNIILTFDNVLLARAGLDVSLNNDSGVWAIAGVPEPTTWAMLLIGFAGIGFASYRRALNATMLKPS
jgi:hypothetical protein